MRDIPLSRLNSFLILRSRKGVTGTLFLVGRLRFEGEFLTPFKACLTSSDDQRGDMFWALWTALTLLK